MDLDRMIPGFLLEQTRIEETVSEIRIELEEFHLDGIHYPGKVVLDLTEIYGIPVTRKLGNMTEEWGKAFAMSKEYTIELESPTTLDLSNQALVWTGKFMHESMYRWFSGSAYAISYELEVGVKPLFTLKLRGAGQLIVQER